MMEVDIDSSHVEVDLNKQTLPHINISLFSHFLTLEQLGILIIVGNEELFVFALQLLKSSPRVVICALLLQRNVHPRSVLR